MEVRQRMYSGVKSLTELYAYFTISIKNEELGVFKNRIRGLWYVTRLITGFIIYLVFNKTPEFAYQAMIGLFCLTKGQSNDVLSKIIGYFKRPYHFSESTGILGTLETTRRNLISTSLREQGYYVFEDPLPEELCEQLLQYASSHECTMRPMDGDKSGKLVHTHYHRGAPEAVRYDFETQDLLDNQDVQLLLADMSLAIVAQDYLGARPVIDVIGLWWHTRFSDKPDRGAAQYYHFDMDRPKWLKFFIYLTDVETTNGPHSFIAGSHQSGAIPSSLLKKGYARLTDEEIKTHFDEKNIIEFNAPRGTIIAEDTRGLHKGKHVQEGDRLILQIQYSNSLFGGYYPKSGLAKDLTENLKLRIKQFPGLYSAYL